MLAGSGGAACGTGFVSGSGGTGFAAGGGGVGSSGFTQATLQVSG